MQLDPLLFKAGDRNAYRFEADMPVDVTDPSGLEQLSSRHSPPNFNKPGTWSAASFEYHALDSGADEFTAKGCIGLCGYRCGLKDPTAPHLSPGTRCFDSLKAALEFKDSLPQSPGQLVVFAVQMADDTVKPMSDGLPGEVDPLSFHLSVYNFATPYQNADGTVNYWEYMNHGCSKPGAKVYHKSELPSGFARTVFCVRRSSKPERCNPK